MPINTTLSFVASVVGSVTPPGVMGIPGQLATYISPPDPDETGVPRAYVWPLSGRENRRAMPRNRGAATLGNQGSGWKNLNHTIMVWLMAFDDTDHNPQTDTTFTGLVDAVMDALRTCLDPVGGPDAEDPWNGQQSVIMNTGEGMSYDIAPLKSTADQRTVIWQAAIRVPVLELLQA